MILVQWHFFSALIFIIKITSKNRITLDTFVEVYSLRQMDVGAVDSSCYCSTGPFFPMANKCICLLGIWLKLLTTALISSFH